MCQDPGRGRGGATNLRPAPPRCEHYLDVVTAFLNPRIDREHVYMHLPPGLEWLDPRFSQVEVVVLLKALYGLKQAP